MTDTSVTTIATKPPIIILRERLEARRGELKAALPGIAPDVFIRALITSATINPDLQAVSWSSLWLACMRACRDGLLPDGREGAIVPYKSTATWIPMVSGLLKRFRQSGQFRWITAGLVRKGETFRHYIDEQGEHFLHEPGDDFSAEILKIYAMASTKDGGLFVTVLTIAEANKIRNMSRATREDSPWKMWPEEMYKKTALRRLAKLLPVGYYEDEDEFVSVPATEAPTLVPVPPPRPASAADALQNFANAPQVGGPHPDNLAGERGGGGSSDTLPSASDDAAAVSSDDDDPIDAAYRHGKQAKLDGFKRGAIPPEYRDEAHQREAIAWQAGFDNKPQPEWSA